MAALQNGQSIRLSDLADHKKLPCDFLSSLGLTDGPRGVLIPYFDITGQEIEVKTRSRLVAKEGSYWPKGKPLVAYGQDHLECANRQGYLIIVEGESDCWALWHHNFPALGVPGATSTKVIERELVEGVTRIYVHSEPDQAGEQFVGRVRDQLSIVSWPGPDLFSFRLDAGTHDPSELHQKNALLFNAKIKEAMDRATREPYTAFSSEVKPTKRISLPFRSITPTPEDDDNHMGDGLTEVDGAGPWVLRIEAGSTTRYHLRSPIWQDSPRLVDGFIVLTKMQLLSWAAIRKEAIDQAGVYVRPDVKKKPVWDGRKGPQLLKRLIENASKIAATPDFDKTLAAAEYLLEKGKGATILDADRKQLFTFRAMLRLDDGTIIFKLRGAYAAAKHDAPHISFENLRDAVAKYGKPYWPRDENNKVIARLHRFAPEHIATLEGLLAEQSQAAAKAPDH